MDHFNKLEEWIQDTFVKSSDHTDLALKVKDQQLKFEQHDKSNDNAFTQLSVRMEKSGKYALDIFEDVENHKYQTKTNFFNQSNRYAEHS